MVLNPCTLFLELFSILAVFRPRLHQFWGLCLTLMHVGILQSMQIHFQPTTSMLFILFLASPLAPKNASLLEIAAALPVVGRLVSMLGASRRKYKRQFTSPSTVRRFISRGHYVGLPLALMAYLCLAYGNFDFRRKDFKTEIFPASPMRMFWRVGDSPKKMLKLERARQEVRKGTESRASRCGLATQWAGDGAPIVSS